MCRNLETGVGVLAVSCLAVCAEILLHCMFRLLAGMIDPTPRLASGTSSLQAARVTPTLVGDLFACSQKKTTQTSMRHTCSCAQRSVSP